MRGYFAYIRVSTPKQGEKGSSLQEQKAAIEQYARRRGLSIVEWFEERETAAKLGRPVFTKLLKALRRGVAAGVITHKIDRSARNLRDWASLGELLDSGVELHFAHDSIDLNSRGGRLAADIQAVVAADYIRNLREEVRKGFYGRLRQGLYPRRAPVGYLDQGRGLPKVIDPIRGPLVATAFNLYATGNWSFKTISPELYACGLRNHRGNQITRNGISTMFRNPFYVGLIRVKKTNELFQGVHPPLVSKPAFDRVQAILDGRTAPKARTHIFRYQRTIRCASCNRTLTPERQKGHVYYRCHTSLCAGMCVREERFDETLQSFAARLQMSESEWAAARTDAERVLVHYKSDVQVQIQATNLAQATVDERLTRLTDAYVDRLLDRDTYNQRREALLNERAALVSKQNSLTSAKDEPRDRIGAVFELLKRLACMPNLGTDEDLRILLKTTISNFSVRQNELVVAWQKPFDQLFSPRAVTAGDPHQTDCRTDARAISTVASDYIRTLFDESSVQQFNQKAA